MAPSSTRPIWCKFAGNTSNACKDAHGELWALDKTVFDSLEAGTILSRQREPAAGRSPDFRRPDGQQGRTFWRQLAAHPGVRRRPWRPGSARTFWACCGRPSIPTPYLVLSCVATLQAPIIMMGQRRQETKNSLRGENDCRINLKAELKICQLRE